MKIFNTAWTVCVGIALIAGAFINDGDLRMIQIGVGVIVLCIIPTDI